MSSMSTRVARAQGVRGLEPSGQGLARAGMTARLLAALDSFLSERLRQGSAEELGRSRVLVGANAVLLLCCLLFLLYVPRMAHPLFMGGVGVVSGAGFVASLLLLRRGRSSRLPGLLLCTMLTGGFLAAGLRTPDPHVGTHAICMLIPILSVYLLGPRPGFVFAAVGALGVGGVLPLWHGVHTGLWLRSEFAALFILGAWALSWLILAARDQANLAMVRALRSLRENQGKLTSLLENTEDIVCSVDADGRLIAANPALEEMYRELIGAELAPGDFLFPERAPERLRRRWQEASAQVLAGKRVRFEASPSRLKRPRVLDISLNPVFDVTGTRVVGMTVFGRDITDRKEAEARLHEMHRSLLDVSRQAGMAEMATGVLHNVGNALNSVNVSVNLLAERLHQSRLPGLKKAMDLMASHGADLAAFLTADGRGRQLPSYLQALASQLTGEREELLEEVHTLQKSVEHIKSVVSMQQEHARFSGVVERLELTALLDDALRLQSVSFERLGIQVKREYTEGMLVRVDRHKLLQILLNLLSNARHALVESGRADKQLIIRVERMVAERLRIAVQDNGVGIAPEDAPRLFTQGFTTKKDGHGFGLHISALAAAEMDAFLSCTSEGRGQGATFTIDLPISGEESRA
ncbi:PAS domain S-box-containing protein [Archangium gephyra]|uniref:histidine kinase n=1 Tax=Archangium gephyra TaxID=48 RepID=A0AAC8TAM9_9BACT|nr:ATP-binding protein [Archangium gephyra]AKI99099.1 sensor histidine kinase [Archangium gephyra]REG31006.1 PAS domain S-box-containing protein [Archangium gephyra]